jgi:hypothetical protein
MALEIFMKIFDFGLNFIGNFSYFAKCSVLKHTQSNLFFTVHILHPSWTQVFHTNFHHLVGSQIGSDKFQLVILQIAASVFYKTKLILTNQRHQQLLSD